MNTQMNLQRIAIEKLKPAKHNPRKDLKPGDPAYEKIKRSLHDFGYVDPVIRNEVTGNFVGGHQRHKVLVAEGATVECIKARTITWREKCSPMTPPCSSQPPQDTQKNPHHAYLDMNAGAGKRSCANDLQKLPGCSI